ncbi:uncharacterized protein LOC107616789 isoform X2 [Arachis ipaensis]|uniref:uncharacterized protein LOC107616789 isoform X2 n=1 Tax=Arachis ipaensis TaxID=130454 RepID=UPI000A2B9319|nr:uncharacterized protein LOC107616789 isoform X2 [Arachis ipaensis]
MSKNPREIKLLCPSLSKVANIIAWDENKIDLGSIAKAFGIEPSTVKLNGHFISRGVDLISCSVTWKSLISFFSSKGLSTGNNLRDALLVTGNFSKLANKREHEPQDFENGNGKVIESENSCSGKRTRLEAFNLQRNKKLKDGNSEGETLDDLCCKRKQPLEGFNLFKKLKSDNKKSGLPADTQDKGDNLSGGISRSPFTCSQTSKNRKRIRDDDDAIVAAQCKRTR